MNETHEPPFDACDVECDHSHVDTLCDECFDARWNVTPDPMGYEAIRAAHPDLFAGVQPKPKCLACGEPLSDSFAFVASLRCANCIDAAAPLNHNLLAA